MDLLDRVAPVGRDLLSRVDVVLQATGAPAGHPVWPLLRRVGTLPGAAVDHLCGAGPQLLGPVHDRLTEQARRYPELVAQIGPPAGWRGDAAGAFAARWGAVTDLIGSGDQPQSLAGRLTATAEYLGAVQDWWQQTRRTVAAGLADCLGSTQAVRLRASGSAEVAMAAADIGAYLLAVVADRLEQGDLLTRADDPVVTTPAAGRMEVTGGSGELTVGRA